MLDVLNGSRLRSELSGITLKGLGDFLNFHPSLSL